MRAVAILFCCAFLMGCPGVKVVKNPDATDEGIRYYRPKPYLLITPEGESVKSEDKTTNKVTTTTTASDEYVSIDLQYLPDFSEEYSIHVRSGVGIANVGMKLENGWNLTEISQNLDSQTDENVKAAAELTKAFGEVFGGTSGGSGSQSAGAKHKMKFVVRATNVPIGYYESVIGYDECGNKQLMGWKYVGFSPFGSCCLATCQNPNSAVYGLVFEQGVMVFKDVTSLDSKDVERQEVSTGEFEVGGTGPASPATSAAAIKTLLENLQEIKNQEGKVTLIPTSPPQYTILLNGIEEEEVTKSVLDAIKKALSESVEATELKVTAEQIAIEWASATGSSLIPELPPTFSGLEVFN